MRVLPLHRKIEKYLRKLQLVKAFEKQKSLLENDPQHPSLHVELLEPKHLRIYSFRVTQRYRAIFIYRKNLDAAEILDVNDHYQ